MSYVKTEPSGRSLVLREKLVHMIENSLFQSNHLVLTSAIEAPMSRGKVAMITDAMRQLKIYAIMNAVRVRDTFWMMVDRRSARALLTRVASAASEEASVPLLFSVKSNHPISFRRIAASQNNYKFSELK